MVRDELQQGLGPKRGSELSGPQLPTVRWLRELNTQQLRPKHAKWELTHCPSLINFCSLNKD